jgi:hypothetical protein
MHNGETMVEIWLNGEDGFFTFIIQYRVLFFQTYDIFQGIYLNALFEHLL